MFCYKTTAVSCLTVKLMAAHVWSLWRILLPLLFVRSLFVSVQHGHQSETEWNWLLILPCSNSSSPNLQEMATRPCCPLLSTESPAITSPQKINSSQTQQEMTFMVCLCVCVCGERFIIFILKNWDARVSSGLPHFHRNFYSFITIDRFLGGINSLKKCCCSGGRARQDWKSGAAEDWASVVWAILAPPSTLSAGTHSVPAACSLSDWTVCLVSVCFKAAHQIKTWQRDVTPNSARTSQRLHPELYLISTDCIIVWICSVFSFSGFNTEAVQEPG